MPCVSVEALVPAADADDVFARITDFPRYADHTDAVREIRVEPGPDGTLCSTWSVNFRNGIMVWRERDHLDPIARRITFEQVSGDFAGFGGGWRVAAAGDDVTVRFDAEFDLGMPSLAAIIDPIAVEALRENIQAIMRGLLGDGVVFLTENDQTEHAQVG